MTIPFQPEEHPHRRFNALTGEWILLSPHRTKRPWQGKQETPTLDQRPAYDPECYLCPGNTRAGGKQNPPYAAPFVFENDFSAMMPEDPFLAGEMSPLLKMAPVSGTCRVICFSPRHDLTLPEMEIPEIRAVIDVWAEQVEDLGRRYRWVQVFENKGAVMGCSNPHPHGQIWAGNFLPNEPLKEENQQRVFHDAHQKNLLVEYLAVEHAAKTRIVVENEGFLVVVPYWATWPFETLLLPKRHVLRLMELSAAERNQLAQILKILLTKYDNLFTTSFPYSMGWHGAPLDDRDYPHWQLHAHFYPPLLRSKTVKKFMVGYEMLAESQRDLTPEQAAKRLHELSEVHYKKNV